MRVWLIKHMHINGSAYCEDDDSATLVDGGSNGFSNTSPSNIAFGTLSATISCDKNDESDDESDDDNDETVKDGSERDEDDDDNDEEEETAKIDEPEDTKSGRGDEEVTKSDREDEEEETRLSDDERIHKEEEEEAEDLYRDVDINQERGLQVSQNIKDSHVTPTLVHPDGLQEISSVK
nr:hypothetical protein [Tanacetum cinerariifolium]